MEMDSTTVILPRHHGRVDAYGNILIYPDGWKAPARARGAAKTAKTAKTRLKSVAKRAATRARATARKAAPARRKK
jgi:hypothetical protein